MSSRNDRVKQRLNAKCCHPDSRAVKQAKRQMRHNLRVQEHKDSNKQLQNHQAGKFNWFKAQVGTFRDVDPRLLQTPEEHKALMKLLSKPKKKRDQKYIERPSDSDDSGLASELDDDDDEDAVPTAGGDISNQQDDEAVEEEEGAPQSNFPEGEVLFPDPLTHQEAITLAYHFTQRHNEELAELQSRRNPPNGAIKRLKGLKEQEEKELRQGMVVPDLTTGSGVASLLSWDGYDRTVNRVDRMKLTYEPKKDELLPFHPMNIVDVKLQRPGHSYQDEAAATKDEHEKTRARRTKALTASGEEKIGFGKAARAVENKVGAKFVSTDEMVQAGRKRRAKKNMVETKRRFHQAITRSRLL